MTQHLWYVRRNGQTSGPFPANQLRELFRIGHLDLTDEVSLDRTHWVGLRETYVLTPGQPTATEPESDEAWRRERERAQLRWLSDADEGSAGEYSGPVGDEVAERLLRHDAQTRELLQARSKRRPAFVAGLAMVLILLMIGIGVWRGQSERLLIRATPANNVPNCAQGPRENVAWAGCDKNDAALSGATLRNANLSGIRLERADLSHADLSYANLAGADLRNANLSGAIMKGATLGQADLTGADLAGADLSYATLGGARLEGTSLTGASLADATWVDGRICGPQAVGACQ